MNVLLFARNESKNVYTRRNGWWDYFPGKSGMRGNGYKDGDVLLIIGKEKLFVRAFVGNLSLFNLTRSTRIRGLILIAYRKPSTINLVKYR